MLSGLAEAIALKNNPVALIWSDAAPTGAMHFSQDGGVALRACWQRRKDGPNCRS